MCALFSPRCVCVCDAFMVTDSFHLSRPFTLKRQLPVKKALWTAPLHRPSQLLLTQAPRNLLRGVHTLLNQPTAEEGLRRAWAGRLPARPQGLETAERLFSQHTRFSQECSPHVGQSVWGCNEDNKCAKALFLCIYFCKRSFEKLH